MTTTTTELTDAQVREFAETGYLILPGVFDDAEIARMAAEADRILALCINASLATGKRGPRIDAAIGNADETEWLDVRKMQPVNDLSDYLRGVSEDERLVGPLRQLMGSPPVIMEEKLNYKQKVRCPEYIARLAPKVGEGRFFLHHDWGYYRQQGYPSDTLSSAVSIDATRSDLGPIRVIPGTHLREWPLKDPDPSHGNGIVEDGLFAEEDRVEIIAPAGSVMLFHSMLLHDSFPNSTYEPRRLMIYSHYPGREHFEEDKRNRGGRLAAQEIEKEYQAALESGTFTDVFPASH